MISLNEALCRVLDFAHPLPSEAVPLDESLGRHLAVDVHARADLPAYDNSAMDGYAVRAMDIASACGSSPTTLRVVSRVFAGDLTPLQIGEGEAARIMTGGKLPEGADSVVRQEATSVDETAGTVDVRVAVAVGKNVRRRGEQMRAGALALRAGQRITPDVIAMLAAVGCVTVEVACAPKVSVVTCGDELCSLDRERAGAIIDSNGPMIRAMAQAAGASATRRGPAPDEPAVLREQLIAAARGADVLITIGGASVGERDLVPDVLRELGARFVFHKIAIKPGKPVGFAVLDSVPIFVLPGNPEACARTFDLLVRPLLVALQGGAARRVARLPATLRNSVRKQPALEYFIRGDAKLTPGGLEVTVRDRQGSAQVGAGVDTNAIAILPSGAGQFFAGAPVEIELRGPLPASTGPLLLGFAGYSGSGKTTVIEALLRRLRARGLRVAALKHDAHEFQLDTEGKDTYRFAQAGAVAVGIASKTRRAVIARTERPSTLRELIGALTIEVELILVEGYKREDVPKIVVNRRGVKQLSTRARDVIAVISDEPSVTEERPCFAHEDHDGLEAFVLEFIANSR
ncbi:MAG: molybdopterin-guanine dinucleotide biosynthesis protein B [Myxococcales bacterium]|nr:molybdopterin-guanine dinucleotide biosynthesis protein B [Myxococcales bacterium]